MSSAPEPHERPAEDSPAGPDGAPGTPAGGPDGERGPEPREAGERHRIDPARMEVRVRRIALLGLVLVPLVYFIAQSVG